MGKRVLTVRKGKVMSSARYFVIFFPLYLFTGNLEKGIDTCVMAVAKSGKGVLFYKIVTSLFENVVHPTHI